MLKALKCAFPYTIPIFAGYWFLGIAYGIYANAAGFSFWYPLITSMLVYGGSLEFVTVSMLLSPFAPVQTFIMAFMIQARHLFYGVSMLGKFKGLGWKKYYLIFGLSDETFSLNYSAEIPEDVDKGWFYVFVTFLDQIYWVSGAVIGGVAGSFITFDTTGIDFAMTALFVVIFLDQWLKDKHHLSEWIGLISSVVCLLIFGADNFMIPTMICILVLLSVFRKPIEMKAGEQL